MFPSPEKLLEHHDNMAPEGLMAALNYAPIMRRGVSLLEADVYFSCLTEASMFRRFSNFEIFIMKIE